ncbi:MULTISPECIES: thioesterase II family protein [unclassified Streptomyces]|uniref:thioesterase II family protein n=1 Tax=unclassified Streptomyces TaxID=2593676 RepID=UPI001BE7776E|nr:MULTISPECIES: alpha/beta fold hydrolase [unclassified Streptomyces]MBT2405505.1 thioesterase [Streptomyces sp. ISL-21]MBT2454423.1 thioesterase [Streptomyces sp. ISL-86]MBT2607816.1 thioesterase [Streptomyces sp. ISL-87]
MVWTQVVEARPFAAERMVCFPHAGGSPYFFRPWAKALGAYEIHAVCYPGRAERFAEECAAELVPMAREIAAELLASDDERPAVFFGHSMGAIVAYEVVRALEEAGSGVAHLFASGAKAPHLMTGDPVAAAAWDEESIARTLIELGGTDPELLNNRAFVELVMPYIGADFRMLAAYEGQPRPPLHCPVTAVVGDADPRVTTAHSAAWRESTRGPAVALTVPGEHFYLADRPPFGLIEEALRPLRG